MKTIDVSDLSDEAVRQVNAVVDQVRSIADKIAESRKSRPEGREETPQEWVARFRAWVDSHEKRDIEIDDDRETIY